MLYICGIALLYILLLWLAVRLNGHWYAMALRHRWSLSRLLSSVAMTNFLILDLPMISVSASIVGLGLLTVGALVLFFLFECLTVRLLYVEVTLPGKLGIAPGPWQNHSRLHVTHVF